MSDNDERTRLWAEWLKTDDGKSYRAGWGDYATRWHAERGNVWVRDRIIERLTAERDALLAACERLVASTSVAGYKAAREAVAKAKGGASDE